MTSSSERAQFSRLNAYSVMTGTPRRTACFRISRIASTPAAWPSISGLWCWRAQRRLPSMMIATCRGRSSAGRKAASSGPPRARSAGRRSGGPVGARATRPRGPPAPWLSRGGRPRRCAGPSSSGGLRPGDATRPVPTFPSRSSRFRWSLASRRMLRISTRASSMRLWTTLTSSLRRSSVNGGMLSRTTAPSTFGTSPMSLFVMAFSMAPNAPVPGLDDDLVGSGTLMPASWLSGVCVP